MKGEYEVLIEDLNIPEDNTIKVSHVLKRTIRRTINERLRSNFAETHKEKGLEIDVPPEWVDILLEDSSILRDYDEVGWKVMWYNKHSLGPGRGDLLRSWLSFRSEANASKER
tara:strand:- start:100 stop:438 length:339 start_codon:yes stop_codon:yes gene_type:complete